MTEKETKETVLHEIKARKEVVKRLQYPLSQLKNVCEKEKQKRKDVITKALEFGSFEEAHEAYGYDMITEDELEQIKEALEQGDEYVENTKTYHNYAYKLLHKFVNSLDEEILALQWDMLSEEEKQKKCKEMEAQS